jgi:chromosomal replication initiation ATPase DnaA
MINCPICSQTHKVTTETLDTKGTIRGVAKCRKQDKLLMVYFELEGRKPVVKFCSKELIQLKDYEKEKIFTSFVIDKVTRRMDITLDELNSKSRNNIIVFARHTIYSFLKLKFPSMTLNRIALSLAIHQDHATILHSFDIIKNILTDKCDCDRREVYLSLKGEIFVNG